MVTFARLGSGLPRQDRELTASPSAPAMRTCHALARTIHTRSQQRWPREQPARPTASAVPHTLTADLAPSSSAVVFRGEKPNQGSKRLKPFDLASRVGMVGKLQRDFTESASEAGGGAHTLLNYDTCNALPYDNIQR